MQTEARLFYLCRHFKDKKSAPPKVDLFPSDLQLVFGRCDCQSGFCWPCSSCSVIFLAHQGCCEAALDKVLRSWGPFIPPYSPLIQLSKRQACVLICVCTIYEIYSHWSTKSQSIFKMWCQSNFMSPSPLLQKKNKKTTSESIHYKQLHWHWTVLTMEFCRLPFV